MYRTFERILMYIIGIWQIIDALITIIVFGLIQNKFGLSEGVSGSFVVTSAIGTLLLGLGSANIVCAKRLVKDNEENNKVGLFLLAQGMLSFLIWDLISLVLSITAGIILLSKNKGIRINKKK